MHEELTPSQAARRIGATTRSVQRWIATGRLPARRVGSRWRVAADVLDAFATRDPGGVVPIARLFIANRGEIARRIERSCRAAGIAAVVPSLDGPGGLDLLDPAAVIDAAVAAGADALHPGVGFLAENADFADAVRAARLVWVGPPPSAMRALGDKASARRLAARLGIPVVPGYDGADQSDEALHRAAAAIGFPILVKPAGGGGGKGMRVVSDAARLLDALAGARREARSAFGDDRLVLERFLESPRHVEVQVLFDQHGAGVHLGERDCSIQRRHQKVLEEAPAPGVGRDLRDRMTDAALRLAHAAGYASAGTAEFLVDDRGAFFFLEMNARLQVEHPVTEAVIGRDLVRDQVRIAAGERLGIAQHDVRVTGHAVEARLYAEDAEAGFLPATGRVEALRWPVGDDLRVDAGIDAGSEVGGRFDPLLAKIIARGADRAEAVGRLRDALDRVVVLGLVTNLRFLRWLVRQPEVVRGEARIDTLDRIWPSRAEPLTVPDGAWSAAAAALLEASTTDPWSGGWRITGRPVVRLVADGVERTASPAAGSASVPDHVRAGETVHVDVDGRSVAFRIAAPPDVDRAAAAATRAHGIDHAEVTAPMPGTVVAVHVGRGDQVTAGDPVVTLEAMKMEHVVTAPITGRVAELLVEPGGQVSRGQPLGTLSA